MSTNLNENQLLAVQMLASGHTGRAIAEKLNVTPETVCRWKSEAEFQAQVNQLLIDSKERIRAKLSDLTTQALDVIETILADKEAPANVKLAAAFKVLDRVGQPDSDLDTNPASIKFTKGLSFFGG